MKYLIKKCLLLASLYILVLSNDIEDKCCETCPSDKIKTYSISSGGTHHCEESCIKENLFWWYNIFEWRLKKSGSNNETSCLNHGYG